MDHPAIFLRLDEQGRPRREWLHMYTAMMWAERSLDPRLKVGALITSLDLKRVLSIGYNGPAKSLPHDYARDEPGNSGCLHAEDNAIAHYTDHQPSAMFVTHSPCEMCAQRIINTGCIRKVYYHQEYRSNIGLSLLVQCDIETQVIY